MSLAWTPLDFILNGEFADAQYLRGLVSRVRAKARADCAVLLVHQDPFFFRSLLYVSHACPDQEAALQEELTNVKVGPVEEEALQDLLAAGGSEVLPNLLGPRLKYTVFKSVCDRFATAPSRLFVPARKPRAPVAAPNAQPLVGVLCIGLTSPPAKVRPPLLNKVAEAVNASAPVYMARLHAQQVRTRRQLYHAEREIEMHFEKPPSTGTAPTVLPPFRDFLQTVLQETQASRGGIFILHDTAKKLVPVARLWRTDDGFAADIGDPIEVEHQGGLVPLVLRKEQPFLFNDRQDFDQMNKTGFIQFPFGPTVPSDAALAVPIVVRRYKSKQRSAIGVLNIEKTSSQPGEGAETLRPFSLADYWFVLEAADRLGDAWTQGWNDVLHRIMNKARQQFRRYPVRRLVAEGQPERAPAAEGLPEGVPAVPAELPSDLAASRGDVLGLLQLLCGRVPTISACTVRVLSVDQTQLALLAAYPEYLTGRFPPTIDPHSNYPMAKVVRKGKEVDGLGSDLPVRLPDLESYIALPLFLQDARCVGVATFASKFTNKFLSYHYPTLWEAAWAIVEAFEFAQTQALAPVLGQSSQVFLSLHELSKIPRRSRGYLQKVRKLLGLDGRRRATAEKDRLLSKHLRGLRNDLKCLKGNLENYQRARNPELSVRPLPAQSTLRELVRRVCLAESASDLFSIHVQERGPDGQALPEHKDRIDPTIFEVCLDALSDLIRNAKRELGLQGREDGEILIHARELGGSSFGCVTICNPLTDRLDPILRPLLFRVPIPIPEIDDRLHYGAFLSAWLVRAVGGDVHLTGSTDTAFRVTVEIPLQLPDPSVRAGP